MSAAATPLPELLDTKGLCAELGAESAAEVWEWLPKVTIGRYVFVLARDLRTYLSDFVEEGTPTTVYQARNADGTLLYVGVTSTKIGRFRNHSRHSSWWTEATSLSLEHYPTRAAALRREVGLISEHRPPYNKAAGETRYTRDRYRAALAERGI